jgi:hypothetical protein
MKSLSVLVLVLCCLSAATFIFVAVAQLPYVITNDSEGWGSMIFSYFTGPLLAGGTLLFGVIPSTLMFWRGGKQTRDRISLCISGITVGLVVLTCVLIEPLRRAVIFRRFELAWQIALAGATGIAVLALVLAGMRSTRKASRWFSIVAIGIGLAPILLHWACVSTISLYQEYRPPTCLLASVVPLIVSGTAVWLSLRVLPGGPQHEYGLRGSSAIHR